MTPTPSSGMLLRSFLQMSQGLDVNCSSNTLLVILSDSSPQATIPVSLTLNSKLCLKLIPVDYVLLVSSSS